MNKRVILLLTVFFFLIIPIPKANFLQTTKIEGGISDQESIKYQDIEYSTFIGGLNLDWGIAIDVDNNQNAFITGTTSSINYPVINPHDRLYNLFGDVFVTKLSPSGKTLDFSTFIGGNGAETGTMIKVDDEGYIYLCGSTQSNNFPIKNSIQDKNKGEHDVFVVKLSPDGKNMIYSTLIGGREDDLARDLDLDNKGCIYVTGRTKSEDFPMKNQYDGTLNGTWDAFIFKLSPRGNELEFSSFIGGEENEWGYGVAVDNNECIYLFGNTSSSDFPLKNPIDSTIKGEESYLIKINQGGSTLNFSTYLGGSQGEKGWGLTIDEQGSIYVCGRTNSTDFPIKNAIQDTKKEGWDMYIAKISSNGDRIIFSTYLGGNGYEEEANRITVDDQGCAYFTGYTTSSDFPVMNPSDGTYNGKWDSFVSKISSNGEELLYSTYLGGQKDDDGYQVAIDNKGSFYVVGWTESVNFPIKNPFNRFYRGLRDVFVTKFTPKNHSFIREVNGGFLLSVSLSSGKAALNWSIHVEGKILFGGGNNGIIPPYSYKTVRLGFTIGVGKANITIRANDIKQYYSAFILGPFFLNLNKF
jgi:hypothetical protein